MTRGVFKSTAMKDEPFQRPQPHRRHYSRAQTVPRLGAGAVSGASSRSTDPLRPPALRSSAAFVRFFHGRSHGNCSDPGSAAECLNRDCVIERSVETLIVFTRSLTAAFRSTQRKNENETSVKNE